jgi:hypothetical protein
MSKSRLNNFAWAGEGTGFDIAAELWNRISII